MIIEAGRDLHELLYPRLIRDHEANGSEGPPLWVAALDDKLRYLYTRPAVTPVRLPLSDHAADIAACLEPPSSPALTTTGARASRARNAPTTSPS
jgi:hypothetical protein